METLKRAFNDRRAVFGATILIVLALMAILAPLLARYSPSQLSNDTWLRPNAQHWLGTTALGQDVFSQLFYGAQLSLLVGLVTGLIAVAISVIVGLAAAFEPLDHFHHARPEFIGRDERPCGDHVRRGNC